MMSTGVDTGEDHVDIAVVLSRGSERHETPLELIQPCQFLLLPLTKHQGAMNAKSRCLFPGSALRPSWKGAQHFWRGKSVEERGSVARQKDNRCALAWITCQSP